MARKKNVDKDTEYQVKCPRCGNFRPKSQMTYGFSYQSCIFCANFQKITANNSVFLPKRIREKLGMHYGVNVQLKVVDDKLVVELANKQDIERNRKVSDSEEDGVEFN